jgi:hypothetical protein
MFSYRIPMAIEAWRKGYNAFPFFIWGGAGIISPATPGRYHLAVATLPEPTPVESEAFVLPCSDVSNVKYGLYPPRNKPTICNISFSTGEGGALDKERSAINLKFPGKFRIKSLPSKILTVNGEPNPKPIELKIVDDGTIAQIPCPVDVENFGKVEIDILHNDNVASDFSRNIESVSVSTSSEPNFIKSENLPVLKSPHAMLLPAEEYTTAGVFIRIPIPQGTVYHPKTRVQVEFPQGFTLPEKIGSNMVFANGQAVVPVIDKNKNTISFSVAETMEGFTHINFTQHCKIMNPPEGVYSIKVSIGKDTYECSDVNVSPSRMKIENLEFSSLQAATKTTLSFRFRPSLKKPLVPGDIISVIFPEGTVLPTVVTESDVVIGTSKPKSVDVDGLTLNITISEGIRSISPVTIKINCQITNPRDRYGFVLSIVTSNGDSCQSVPVDLLTAPLKSWIYFKDPDQPNCGEWFNKPPILGFACLNPEAKITFWFNNEKDKSMNYGGEQRMATGSQRVKITWMSEYGDKSEEPQTISYFLDTVPPPINITEPKSEKIVVNKKSVTVEGERGFTEMLTDGDNEKFQVTDSIFVRLNGQETQLLSGEIYETANSGNITYKFKHTLNLREGENVVEFIARDQACNEKTISKTIILDSTPPEIILINEPQSNTYYPGANVTLEFETEDGANVDVDGRWLSPSSREGSMVRYAYNHRVVAGENKLDIVVADLAGNKTKKTIKFQALKPKEFFLTLDSNKWTVNGIEQTPLKTAPTSKNLPNDLKGSTFMPIAEIAPLLDCKVDWDSGEKKLTLSQTSNGQITKTIELWIGNRQARINGQSIPIDKNNKLYPIVMGGKTLLPLRFVAENLGAGVVFDSKTKNIFISYPKLEGK